MADTAPAANGGSNIDALKNNAAAAYDSVTNGPVAQNVKDQSAKTTAELNNLAASRQTPTQPAATGQPLTHYHSFFSELLSWNNPRASGIAYASIVTFIFAVRYLDVIRWSLKLSGYVLATTVAAEVVGKAILGTGFASQLRPRRYYTVSRETLESMTGDVHELLNFFCIESQRILFAENVTVSAVACIGALISYWLVKIVPYWGLALMTTTLAFVAPLIYKTNKEMIDEHLKQVSSIVESQTNQLKEVAGKHTAQATELTKQYMGDCTAKAQSLLRGRSPETVSKTPAAPAPADNLAHDLPSAPTTDIKTTEPITEEKEPLLAL
ncbi:hypothetical protein MCOR02_007418 [Pyricularia oryzae]|nr:hypothetical protein MCOR02_007418 [Pyricularia oryzae]KAI6322711.1 hypothetical protein MCOR34_002125 [Pyricularia oryzae]KAI6463851.1 hypothetical protein MCOR17_005521 [Pyricularia oryzae]KAI6512522.1 hypothetical protein MCOR13_000311 [Pyricularia oryzae]KAI6602132.1 hypothetical protein MCOR04_002041 [Pyricularia oryzae]